jgi:hypothetical protein
MAGLFAATPQYRQLDVASLAARLVNTGFSHANLRGAEVSFANADGANFFRANLDGCLMYRTEIRHARFDEAKITHESDIPNWRNPYADKRIKRNKEDFALIPKRPRALLVRQSVTIAERKEGGRFSLHLLPEHALLTGKNFPANYLPKKSKGAVH